MAPQTKKPSVTEDGREFPMLMMMVDDPKRGRMLETTSGARVEYDETLEAVVIEKRSRPHGRKHRPM